MYQGPAAAKSAPRASGRRDATGTLSAVSTGHERFFSRPASSLNQSIESLVGRTQQGQDLLVERLQAQD
jgi:hypothetical protein